MLGLDVLRFITLPESNIHLGVSPPRIVSQAWSLGMELWFYLAAPFIVRMPLKFSAAVLFACLAVRFFLLPFDYEPWRYYFAPSIFCFFLMGHMSHRLGALIASEALKWRIGLISLLALPFAGDFTSVNVTQDVDRIGTWIFIMLFAAALPFIFSLTKKSSIDSAVGNLSYPLYLVHRLVYAAMTVPFSGKSDVLALGLG